MTRQAQLREARLRYTVEEKTFSKLLSNPRPGSYEPSQMCFRIQESSYHKSVSESTRSASAAAPQTTIEVALRWLNNAYVLSSLLEHTAFYVFLLWFESIASFSVSQRLIDSAP